MNDPDDTRWEYTYHGRFEKWGQWKSLVDSVAPPHPELEEVVNEPESMMVGSYNVDQIEAVIAKLVEQPFTRQAQMITWMPNLDLDIFDPPCLQSLWCRIAEEDGIYYLNYNIRIRSNDAWGAYFMNSFGLTMFVKEVIANEVAKRTGKEVKLARMNWQADSWHIYGKDIKEAKARLFDRLDKTKFEDRIFNFNDEMIKEMYDEAEEAVKKKIADYDSQN
jgi:thymidylate synthase